MKWTPQLYPWLLLPFRELLHSTRTLLRPTGSEQQAHKTGCTKHLLHISYRAMAARTSPFHDHFSCHVHIMNYYTPQSGLSSLISDLFFFLPWIKHKWNEDVCQKLPRNWCRMVFFSVSQEAFLLKYTIQLAVRVVPFHIHAIFLWGNELWKAKRGFGPNL